MAADRERQQNGTADLPFFLGTMKANGKRDCADCRADYNRCGNENGIPQDDARDFECGHPRVVHRGDAAGNEDAADP
jgi:hypothetical protein